MRTLSKLARLGMSTALLAAGLTVGTAAASNAATTCGSIHTFSAPKKVDLWAPWNGTYSYGGYVTQHQYCPIWKSNTPVMSYSDGNTFEVGQLVNSGWANWFICRSSGKTFTHYPQGYTSSDWALTLADNGRWGFVSAAYFSGSDSYWANLRPCTGSDLP